MLTLKAKTDLKYGGVTFLFLLPWLLCFAVFSVFPIGYSLYLSFTKFIASGNTPPEWVGAANYQALLNDERFIRAAGNSLYFMLGSVPLTTVLAVITAILLNQNIRLRTFYRVALFMPVVSSMFVTATLFAEIYARDGFANQLLALLGAEPVNWLRDPNWAMPSIIIMNIWASFGFYSLVILAALQSIPYEYYEVAQLEGIPPLRRFFTLTLPLIRPTVIFCFILNSILAFQVFGEIYIMTKGGPLGSTETAVFYIYDTAFAKRDMGYASAAAYLVFVFLAVFSVFQVRLSASRKLKKV